MPEYLGDLQQYYVRGRGGGILKAMDCEEIVTRNSLTGPAAQPQGVWFGAQP